MKSKHIQTVPLTEENQPISLIEPWMALYEAERARAIELALGQLTWRGRVVISLLFGLHGQYVYSMEDVAKLLRVGRERIGNFVPDIMLRLTRLKSRRLRVFFEELE